MKPVGQIRKSHLQKHHRNADDHDLQYQWRLWQATLHQQIWDDRYLMQNLQRPVRNVSVP